MFLVLNHVIRVTFDMSHTRQQRLLHLRLVRLWVAEPVLLLICHTEWETIFHSLDLDACQPCGAGTEYQAASAANIVCLQIELKVYVNLISYGFWWGRRWRYGVGCIAHSLIGIRGTYLPTRKVVAFAVCFSASLFVVLQ